MSTGRQPDTLEEAQAYFDKGSFGRAESVCQRILKQDSQSIGAMFLLALIHQEQNLPLKAITEYLRLVTINPNIAEAYYNMGVLLQEQHDYEAAANCQRRVIALRPDWTDAYNNLGIALLEDGDRNGAAENFRRAIELDANHRAAWLNLGSARIKGAGVRAGEDVLQICLRAVELNPEAGQAHYNLGIVLENLGQLDESLAAMRRAVQLCPDKEMWKYYLTFKEGGSLPSTAPVSYVTELFDAYAGHFDDHLVGRLEYQTPRHLYEELSNFIGDARLDILDLGCGTGLCGDAFKSCTKSIVGVDLSPRMIDVARGKGLYTELHVGEINAVMSALPSPFDAVVSADVFIYVGDLSQTFAQVHKILRPGGWFVFSVEKHEGTGVILQPTRRFSHSLPYLREMTAAHGFTERRQCTRSQRKESGSAIEGYILVLQKSG